MNYKFKDEEHKAFFEEQVAKTNSTSDPFRKSLFYALGLTKETRNNIEQLYDYSESCIEFEGLKKGWQTGTTTKVCRLAFNLYNGLHGEHDEKERASSYTPYELFDCSLMEYMFEAVRIRYEEYSWLPY